MRALLIVAVAWTAARANPRRLDDQRPEICPPTGPCVAQPFHLYAVGCAGLAGLSLDSGWLPNGDDEEIQIRFEATLGGLIDENRSAASVAMDAEVIGSWPEVSVIALGCPQGGELRVAYGIELRVTIRYDLRYEGVGIRGEVPIPVPFLSDLADGSRMEARTVFDPFALKAGVSARGESEPFTIFEYDVLGLFFDISIDTPLGDIEVPVEGGFRLDLQGFTEGRYQTRSLVLDGLPVGDDGVSMALAAPPGGWGGGKDLPLVGEGALGCEVGLQFIPVLFLSIANKDFEWVIPVDLHVTLDRDQNVVPLQPGPLRLPFPDAVVETAQVDLGDVGQGAGGRGEIAIRNVGEAPLHVQGVASEGLDLRPPGNEIQPGDRRTFEVARVGPGAGPGRVDLTLDDPDQPSATVAVTWRAPGPSPRRDGGGAPPAAGADGGPGTPRADGGAAAGPGVEGVDGGGVGAADAPPGVRQSGGCLCDASDPGSISALWLLILTARRRRRTS